MFKKRELVKTEGAEEWQQEECLWDVFIKNIIQLQRNGAEKQSTIINEGSLQSN
jgi:hypothetical protein